MYYVVHKYVVYRGSLSHYMRDEHECNYIVESGQAETCLTRELVLENAAWLAGRSHEGRATEALGSQAAAKRLRILKVLKFRAILLVLV